MRHRSRARQTCCVSRQRLENGAANAYIGVIPSFGDRNLAQVSARLAADEAMHWTVLTQALKDPLPGQGAELRSVVMRLPALLLVVFALAAAAPAAATDAAPVRSSTNRAAAAAIRSMPTGSARRIAASSAARRARRRTSATRPRSRARPSSGRRRRSTPGSPTRSPYSRPAHELPRRLARGSRRHHRLPAPAVWQVSAGGAQLMVFRIACLWLGQAHERATECSRSRRA